MIDILASPRDAFSRAPAVHTLIVFITFVLLVFAGDALQQPAVRNVEIATISSSYPSAAQAAPRAQAIEQIREASLVADILQWTLALLVILTGVALGAVIAYAVTFLTGGSQSFAMTFKAALLIAIPTIGLYQITCGLIVLFGGSASFTTYDSLNAITPSILNVLPAVGSEFWRSFFASINVFSVWMAYLYATYLRSAGTSVRLAWITGVGITLLGSCTIAAISAIST